MSKPIRILTAILASLAIGGMFAYQDAQKNEPTYQQHPVTVILTDFFGASLCGLIFYFVSGWLERRKEKKLKQAGDDKFYDEVARELQEKSMVAGLWTKAYAEMGGDDAKARALYIKYRVAQLAEASRQQREQKRAKIKAAEEQQWAEIEAAERKARTRAHRIGHKILWIIFILLIAIFGISCLACIVVPLTEGANSDDLVGSFVAAIILGFITFLCVKGADHCYKEMQ